MKSKKKLLIKSKMYHIFAQFSRLILRRKILVIVGKSGNKSNKTQLSYR